MTGQPATSALEGTRASPQRTGVFVCDTGGLCFWANAALGEIVGLPLSELRGQFWFRIFNEDDRKKAVTVWEASIDESVPFSFSGIVAPRGQKARRITVQSELVPAHSDRPEYCVGFITEGGFDGTPTGRYDRLQEALEKVERLERERFDLSASLNIADTTINQLQGDLARRNQKTSELTKRSDQLSTALTTTQAKLTQTEASANVLESTLKELRAQEKVAKEEQQKVLDAARAEIEERFKTELSRLESLKVEKEKLEKEVAESKLKLENQESRIVKLTERSREQQKQLEDRVRSLEQAGEREKAKIAATLADREKEYAQAKSELDAQLAKMLGEASDLLTTKKQMSERLLNAERQLEKAKTREKDLLMQLQGLEKSAGAERAVSTAQADALQSKKGIEEELEKERQKNKDLIARLAELGARLAKAQEEVEDGRTAVKAISNESGNLEDLKKKSERDLADARSYAQRLEREVGSLKLQLEVETSRRSLSEKQLKIATSEGNTLPSAPASESGRLDAVLDETPEKLHIPPAAQTAQTPTTEQKGKLKILVAEDNRINQNVILRILKRANHEVVLAHNGKDAAEKTRKSDYDLILMDCQMPQMDGYQATQEIREFQRTRALHSKIIGMSAHLDMDGRDRCIAAGMDDYISKPIQEEKLTALLNKLFP